MRLRKRYVDLNDTLRALKRQVIDGLDYAEATTPHNVKTPRDVWNFLKPRLKYANDPRNTELLQTYETLMLSNEHGRRGRGDCDCFTIATLSVGIVVGFPDMRIVLAGRDRANAVHIYTAIYENGRRYVLDFTEPEFNSERKYKYTQEIPVQWQKWHVPPSNCTVY
jgi:hypothetical protein